MGSEIEIVDVVHLHVVVVEVRPSVAGKIIVEQELQVAHDSICGLNAGFESRFAVSFCIGDAGLLNSVDTLFYPYR